MPPSPPTEAEIQACRDALAAHGGVKAKAARALGIPITTLKDRLSRTVAAKAEKPPKPVKEDAGRVTRDRLGRIADLLERSGIPVEEVGRVERIRLKAWQGLSKNDAGEAIVTDMHGEGLDLTPKWADGPAWPVVQPAPLVTIAPMKRPPQPKRDHKVCVVLPDMQINYFVGRKGELISTHDETALGIALQIIEDANPDVVAMNGDNLDLSEMSKYRKMPIFQRMTQPTIDRVARLMASIRARVRPECRLIWLEGNHELRMPVYVLDNASAAYGLKRANAPDSWPVMSVPHLCRLDNYGVEYIAGYPSNGWMLNDNLEIGHGNKAKSGGSTCAAYLAELRHSLCVGHIHREELATVTRKTMRGPRTYEAFSFGCLCKTDGRVPGSESGFDLHGQPIKAQNNWTNGLGVIEYQEGDGDFWREHVRIWHGMTRWRGKTYSAPLDLAEAS